jgi:hypothetical protein
MLGPFPGRAVPRKVSNPGYGYVHLEDPVRATVHDLRLGHIPGTN